jgi:hypothetical protein
VSWSFSSGARFGCLPSLRALSRFLLRFFSFAAFLWTLSSYKEGVPPEFLACHIDLEVLCSLRNTINILFPQF